MLHKKDEQVERVSSFFWVWKSYICKRTQWHHVQSQLFLDYSKIVIKNLQYILIFSSKASAMFSDNGVSIVHAMLSGHGSFFSPCICVHMATPTLAVNESVHFSMFHWPQQYCKPLHIHSSRTPNRITDKDCGAATSYPSHPAPKTRTLPLPTPRPPKYTPNGVRCESLTWLLPVHLFWADCFGGFCHHHQKILGDNLLEFGLGLPLSRFAHP